MATKRPPARDATPDEEESLVVHAALTEAVENQIRDNEPAVTASTLSRLLGEGYSRDAAIDLITLALAAEVWQVKTFNRKFDLQHYTTLLESLPAAGDEDG